MSPTAWAPGGRLTCPGPRIRGGSPRCQHGSAPSRRGSPDHRRPPRAVDYPETFPLKCSVEELRRFIEDSRCVGSSWIRFYWGRTPEELRPAKTISEALTL